jgi:hypothetical protein
MVRWWKTLGRTDQIALVGVLVALLGILPTYLVFFQDGRQEPVPVVTTIAATKPVTDSSQALTIRIPENWGHINAAWLVSYRGKQDVGAGIQAGTGAALHEDRITFSDPNTVVAASTEFAKRMEFLGRPESDLASWSRATERLIDWSKEGCVLVSERSPRVQGFIGTLRVWENCHGLQGSHVFDYIGVSRVGDAVLWSQVLLPPRFSEQIAEHIIESVVVRQERLPRGASFTPVRRTLEVPPPYWSKAAATTTIDTSGDQSLP